MCNVIVCKSVKRKFGNRPIYDHVVYQECHELVRDTNDYDHNPSEPHIYEIRAYLKRNLNNFMA